MFAFSRSRLRLTLVLLASFLASAPAAFAQPQPRPLIRTQQPGAVRRPPPPPGSTFRIAGETDASQEMELEVGRSRVVHFRESIVRVSIVDPGIADVRVITPHQLLINAKQIGNSYLTVWASDDRSLVVALRIVRDLVPIKRQIGELFPGERVRISSTGTRIVLSGEVSDLRLAEKIAAVARLYAKDVTNLLRVAGDQQVQIEVRFAEVSRSGLRQLGFSFFYKDAGNRVGGLVYPGGVYDASGFLRIPGAPVETPATGNPGAFNVFFSNYPGFPFGALMSALEQEGLVKTIAEPTLVAMSGQEAKFLAGGEFPIPFSGALGQVSVIFKKFGIILSFIPTVLGQGTINLKVSTEVSDVDTSVGIQSAGVVIPGISSRQSETSVQLRDGQTFAIAGLLSDRVRSTIQKLPFLGDIPILGALFRSTSYRRDETELLVLVTTRLVRPLRPHEVPAMPGEHEVNDPDDFELFLLGRFKRLWADRDQPQQRAATRRPLPGNEGPAGAIGFVREVK
jgi:pilus assembly protein CpaC